MTERLVLSVEEKKTLTVKIELILEKGIRVVEV